MTDPDQPFVVQLAPQCTFHRSGRLRFSLNRPGSDAMSEVGSAGLPDPGCGSIIDQAGEKAQLHWPKRPPIESLNGRWNLRRSTLSEPQLHRGLCTVWQSPFGPDRVPANSFLRNRLQK